MRHKITKAEQEVIIEKAIQLLKNNPYIKIYELYKLTTKALGLYTAEQVPWFHQRIKTEKEKLLLKQQEPVKQQKQQEPIKPIHQFIDDLLIFKDNLEKKLNNIEEKQNNLEDRLKNIEGITSSYKRILESILGDLTNYIPKKEEIKEEIKKESKLKIAIIGPLKDQYNEISYKIGNKAKLEWLDKERNLNIDSMKGFNYIVISRHCRHHIYWDAKAAIGDKKVFRIATGGIQSIANKITEIINNEGL